jgi:hypothetical protein
MLSGTDLVDVWASGRAGAPAAGADALLARLGDDVGAMTPGARDRALLDMHAAAFGALLDGVATCPRCGELLDVGVRIDELVGAIAAPSSRRVVQAGDGSDVQVEFRLPTVGDLRAGPSDGDALLDRCVTRATVDGAEVAPGALPSDVRHAVEAAMEEGDPFAELTLSLACVSCDHVWGEALDPAPFVWAALGDAARRLVADVADLASAFGWSEGEVLAMSPGRRRLYLEVVRAS